jgi:hypothetical protein
MSQVWLSCSWRRGRKIRRIRAPVDWTEGKEQSVRPGGFAGSGQFHRTGDAQPEDGSPDERAFVGSNPAIGSAPNPTGRRGTLAQVACRRGQVLRGFAA